jgi:Mrp family chromosome partitioning ATPase
LAGAGLGTLAGLGTILLLAVIDDPSTVPEELREALVSRDILLLGQLPIVRNLEGEEIEPILADANANYLPYYERLRSTLRRIGSGEMVKVVIVTSITGGEGKTATAYNLAIAVGFSGPTDSVSRRRSEKSF